MFTVSTEIENENFHEKNNIQFQYQEDPQKDPWCGTSLKS